MSSPSQNRQNRQNRSNIDLFELYKQLWLEAYRQITRSFRSGSETCAKIPYASVAVSKRLTGKSSPSLVSDCSVPSLNVPVVKVQDCPEEFDETPREAKFAFRKTDLGSCENSATRTLSPSSSSSGGTTNRDPAPMQHWTVVIHYTRGNLTYVFEANNDAGRLEGYRARHVDYEVFERAIYFGTAVTSPRELLELAKRVSSNGTPYNVIDNNCQTWLKQFLQLISPDLCQSFDVLLDELNFPIIAGLLLIALVIL